MTASRRLIAVFGGTFDPIHWGHLRSIAELQQRLQADELRIIPCHLPPHRPDPGANSAQRLKMLQLATQDTPDIVVDDRELRRGGVSYTVDTLSGLHDELRDEPCSTNGQPPALCWIMGGDAFAALDSWHRWGDLLNLANVVVMQRPGSRLPESGPVAELLAQHRVADVDNLRSVKAGAILPIELQQWPISATEIRRQLSSGENVGALLPDEVQRYISAQQLYRS